MTRMRVFYLFTIAALVGSCTPSAEDAPADEPMEPTMSFFLTSAGPGNGAALGGVQGADRYCQSLADAVGAGATPMMFSWRSPTLTRYASGGGTEQSEVLFWRSEPCASF